MELFLRIPRKILKIKTKQNNNSKKKKKKKKKQAASRIPSKMGPPTLKGKSELFPLRAALIVEEQNIHVNVTLF